MRRSEYAAELPQYLWQAKGWPDFRWERDALAPLINDMRLSQGRLLGRVASMGFPLEQEAHLRILVEEAVSTSRIEGEVMDPLAVRSSVARRLGLPSAGLPIDRKADGLVEVLLDAGGRADAPLTAGRLHSWHAVLFPAGRSGLRRIRAGQWRSGPISVVSGPIGRERVHYVAPPADKVPSEMRAFLRWWKQGRGGEGLIQAGLAHLWFVLIHPFEDGNGRIARALADMAVAADDRQPYRYYSLSAQIMRERDDYYRVLETTSRGDLDITTWLAWFLECFGRAIKRSEAELAVVFARSRFWALHGERPLSARQRKVIGRLLEAGPGGFTGGMTTRKYLAMTDASRATAFRELEQLRSWGILAREGAGRSVRYGLVWPEA